MESYHFRESIECPANLSRITKECTQDGKGFAICIQKNEAQILVHKKILKHLAKETYPPNILGERLTEEFGDGLRDKNWRRLVVEKKEIAHAMVAIESIKKEKNLPRIKDGNSKGDKVKILTW